jgi:broad specificity phosphatase PhoE
MASKTELIPSLNIKQSKNPQVLDDVLDENFRLYYDPFNYNIDSDTPSRQIDNSSLNCVLFTHNTTLRCFVSKILIEQGKPYSILPLFKNCAILCLTINLKNRTFELKMVYDGTLTPDEMSDKSQKTPYYTSSNELAQNNFGILFETINGKINDKELNLLPIDIQTLFNKYNVGEANFYEVKNVLAEHNDKSNWFASKLHLKKDTSITSDGITQANESAKAFKRIIREKQIYTMFCSDLKITRDTASQFFDILSDNLLKKEIIILPCSEKLSEFGENCYEKSSKSWNISRENYPDCNPKKCTSFKTTGNRKIKIKWGFYSAFYHNKMRNTLNLKDVPNCKDTTMIAMMVYYLLNIRDDIKNTEFLAKGYDPNATAVLTAADFEDEDADTLGETIINNNNKVLVQQEIL